MKKAFLIHGPNFNLLELREANHYDSLSLKDIEEAMINKGKEKNLNIISMQSNHEGEIIDFIHKAILDDAVEFILINAAAYSHTSIAILDALKIFKGQVIELHLSDISKREEYRKKSFISERADKIFFGKGIDSYKEALNSIL